MRILVTGGSGMLGHALMRRAAEHHAVFGTYRTHPAEIAGCQLVPLDITDGTMVEAVIGKFRPDVVIHTAALTDVDGCERAPQMARRINSDGTAIVAKATEQAGAQLIYISTDYVFDGAKGSYVESDPPNPVNQYGASKSLGEDYARQYCTRTTVIRTTMFGIKLPPQVGMMESMVAALGARKPMTRFVDQFFSPLYTGHLSEAIVRLAERQESGLFHIGALNPVSRFTFAREVARVFGCADLEICPGPFQQIDGLARRPKDTSLVSDKVTALLGISLPAVHDGLFQLKRDWQGLDREGMALH